MRQVLQKQMVFKKEHTSREIYQYIVDPDAPPLTLALKPWYFVGKVLYTMLNIVATFLSCLALIWLSYPEYIDSSSYTGKLNVFNGLEILSVVFFTIDYILRFVATDKVALDFFVFDFMNVLDVFTTVPFYLQLIVAASGSDPGGLFRFFFVVRMSRVIRLSRYHRGMAIIMESLKSSMPMLILFLLIAMITIAITSSAIFFAEVRRYDDPTGLWYRDCPRVLKWFYANFTRMPRPGENCTEQVSPLQSISDGMYWSAVVMSLNGFSEQLPTSVLGKIVTALTTCVGIMLFVSPATIMTANYKEHRNDAARKQVTSQLSERATSAMKAQEVLRKEMERSYRMHKHEMNEAQHANGNATGGNGDGDESGVNDVIAAIPIAKKHLDKDGRVTPAPEDAFIATGGFELEDDGAGATGGARGATAASQARKLKALQAVLPQSELSGKLKMEVVSEYVAVCAFTFHGETHLIYQVKANSLYVYEPLLKLKYRDVDVSSSSSDDEAEHNKWNATKSSSHKSSTATPSTPPPPPRSATGKQTPTPPPMEPKVRQKRREIYYTDDFNVRTAERILTCYIVMDSDEARAAARTALVDAGIIERDTPEGDVLVLADRSGPVNVQHDYEHIYPDLASIVYLDELANVTATNGDTIGVRFVVVMPHQHGIEDAMRLLKNTRLAISVGIRKKQFTYHFPLSITCIMASRLIRELVIICYTRPSDMHQVAYIHQHDVQMLLEGFCDQYIPTPSGEVLVTAPHVVDQQVFLALKACCPSIRLDYVPLEAANSCYRSAHLNPQASDQYLMEVDLTLLDSLDTMGYGTRIKLHVPMCEEVRYDGYIAIQ